MIKIFIYGFGYSITFQKFTSKMSRKCAKEKHNMSIKLEFVKNIITGGDIGVNVC